MSLMDRFKGKKTICIVYRKEDMEELLQTELTDKEYDTLRKKWNEDINDLDLDEVDTLIQEWFADNFKMKIVKK